MHLPGESVVVLLLEERQVLDSLLVILVDKSLFILLLSHLSLFLLCFLACTIVLLATLLPPRVHILDVVMIKFDIRVSIDLIFESWVSLWWLLILQKMTFLVKIPLLAGRKLVVLIHPDIIHDVDKI